MTARRRTGIDATPTDPVLRALAFRCARIEERLGALASSLDRLWNVVERRAGGIAPRLPAPIPQRSLEPRVGAREAAKLIGCDVRTVRRLIESGQLRGSALRLAGGRRHWSAETADVERLLATKCGSPAAPAASKPEIASKRRTSDARMTICTKSRD